MRKRHSKSSMSSGDRFGDSASVLVEPGRQLGALTDRVLGGLIVRIGLTDVDRWSMPLSGA